MYVFFFSSRRRHTRLQGDWSSDVCSSDLLKRSHISVKKSVARPRGWPKKLVSVWMASRDLRSSLVAIDVQYNRRHASLVPSPLLHAAPVRAGRRYPRDDGKIAGQLESRRSRSEERRVGKEGRSR